MKNFKLLTSCCIALSFSLVLNAQVNKLYGFIQPVYGGVAQEIIDGKLTEDKSSSLNDARYFIYASISDGLPVKVIQLSLQKKIYSCRVEIIKAPVILPSSDPGIFHNDTLIMKAPGYLIKVNYFTDLQLLKPDYRLKKLQSQNEVVLVYKIQNRMYYSSLKKLKVLHPLFTEGANKN